MMLLCFAYATTIGPILNFKSIVSSIVFHSSYTTTIQLRGRQYNCEADNVRNRRPSIYIYHCFFLQICFLFLSLFLRPLPDLSSPATTTATPPQQHHHHHSNTITTTPTPTTTPAKETKTKTTTTTKMTTPFMREMSGLNARPRQRVLPTFASRGTQTPPPRRAQPAGPSSGPPGAAAPGSAHASAPLSDGMYTYLSRQQPYKMANS